MMTKSEVATSIGLAAVSLFVIKRPVQLLSSRIELALIRKLNENPQLPSHVVPNGLKLSTPAGLL